jgi:hypothetical protein
MFVITDSPRLTVSARKQRRVFANAKAKLPKNSAAIPRVGFEE